MGKDIVQSEEKNEDKRKRSIWGPELLMVLLFPPLSIAAIVLTVYLAQQYRFTPSPTIQTGRFADVQTVPPTDSESLEQAGDQETLSQEPTQ